MKDKKNKRGPRPRQRKSKWQKWWREYFYWNNEGIRNWWEYSIPFLLVLLMEIIAELVAKLIIG